MTERDKLHISNKGNNKEEKLSFGEVIAKYRTKNDLNQQKLADMLGATKNTVCNWEKGKSFPDAKAITNLVNLLGIPIHELFGMNNTEGLTSSESGMIDNYRHLSPVSQKTIYNIISEMRKQEDNAFIEHVRDKFRILPLEATPAAAGVGCMEIDNPPEPFFVTNNRISSRADAIVRVSGRSMEPAYYNGDYVYITLTNSADDGDDVICVYSEGFIIKRYRGGGIYSVNDKYPFGGRKEHEYDNIHMIGVVLGKVEDDELPNEDENDVIDEIFHDELREFDKKHHRDEY